jgi:ABC-type dipeptide/oligopeptide/nickel transport system permease component
MSEFEDNAAGCGCLLLVILSALSLVLYLSFWIFVIAGAIGAPVGVFQGVRNYYRSIDDNINNTGFRVLMFVITSLFTLLLLALAFYVFTEVLEIKGI